MEQQVSLASALSGEITAEGVLTLSDEELKACYFSRQKTRYVKHLAEMIVEGQLDLAGLEHLSDAEVRQQLCAVKGIGNWTVDVYLMFVLHRADVFPVGDLAAVNALKKVKALAPDISKDGLLLIAEGWKPYRTVATMLLWHIYLEEKKR